MMLFWFSLPTRPIFVVVCGALEDLLVVALVAVGRRGDPEGGPVSLGRGLGIPLLGDVVNLKTYLVIGKTSHTLKVFNSR